MSSSQYRQPVRSLFAKGLGSDLMSCSIMKQQVLVRAYNAIFADPLILLTVLLCKVRSMVSERRVVCWRDVLKLMYTPGLPEAG